MPDELLVYLLIQDELRKDATKASVRAPGVHKLRHLTADHTRVHVNFVKTRK